MKNKLLATIAAFGLVGSASAIEINDNLSINGFIDGSYQYSDTDLSTTTAPAGADDAPFQKDQALGVDEVELNFITNVGNVDGVINLDSHDGLDDVEVEQAHITYSMDSGVSFTLGKYGSALGFEREDPTSLYTFSRAYGGTDLDNNGEDDSMLFNLGDVDSNVVEGFTVAYSNDIFSLGASFENALSTDAEDDDLNLEVAVAYTGIENVNIGLGYYFDNQANTNEEIDILNVHASALLGKLLVAAEYTELNRGGNNSDLDGYMFLADYDVTDKLGVAVRVSSNETQRIVNGAVAGGDYEKLTIAPNYAITESLGAIIEYSDIDVAGEDSNLFAVELLYTF